MSPLRRKLDQVLAKGLGFTVMLCIVCELHASERKLESIAVLPPVNATGDTNFSHWQPTLCLLLNHQLREVDTIRVVSDRSLDFSQKAWSEPDEAEAGGDTASREEQVRRIGRTLQVNWMVWGSYRRDGVKWSLSVQVMDVNRERTWPLMTAASSDWFQVISQTRKGILEAMQIGITTEEERRVARPPTTSEKALELFSYALAGKDSGESPRSIEQTLGRALRLEPNFQWAQELLAVMLMVQGNSEEAAEGLKPVVKAHPDAASAHYLLGIAYLDMERRDLAKNELLEAQRLEPEQACTFVKLGELYGHEEDGWTRARSEFLKAEALDASDPLVHADLAQADVFFGWRDKALAEMKIADDCSTHGELLTLSRLGAVSDLLNDVPRAVGYYEKLLAATSQIELHSSLVEEAKAALARLKPRLTPHFVKAAIPQTFGAGELERVLWSTLSPRECVAVVNPLEDSPEMEKWAIDLVGDAKDEMTKAKRLFQGITQRADLRNPSAGWRSAQQAFQDWRNPETSLNCQDYAFLLVALARDVGLRAYFVLVNKDTEGRCVSHGCAGLFIDGKALLADPSYDWFGAPHQGFEFQNDLQALGLYLCESDDITKNKVAVKLLPERALPYFNLAITLGSQGKAAEAREAVQSGLRLDGESAMALITESILERQQTNFEAAITLLRRCVSLGSDCTIAAAAHYYLASIYEEQGKHPQAVDEYRTYLRGPVERDLAFEAEQGLARLGVTIPESIEKASLSGAGAYEERGLAFSREGEIDAAIDDFTVAIGLDPKNAKTYAARASAYIRNWELDKAVGDCNEALRLNPKNYKVLDDRGFAHMEMGQFNPAIEDFRQVLRLNPSDGTACRYLAWLRATAPVSSLRDGKEAVQLAQKGCELTGWKEWVQIATLAAAYAEAGDFTQAVKFQKQVLATSKLSNSERVEMERMLSGFQRQQPYRQATK